MAYAMRTLTCRRRQADVLGDGLVRTAALMLALAWACPSVAQAPETVTFASADDKVKLTGFVFLPDAKRWPGKRPAVVLLHGRSGVFSSVAKEYDASTLGSRTVLWGRFWAERGYVGLYVDSFGPRGYHKGFEAGTNDGRRPAEVNEITVRPQDAYMGLKYLRSRAEVQPDRVFLQGWSNGGSATLSAMARDTVAKSVLPVAPTAETGFRAAIAVYPACTPVSKFYGSGYRPYAPLLLLIGAEDEEVSYANCQKFATAARAAGSELEFVSYAGAQHSYDTPTAKRKSVPANVRATDDTKLRAEVFFGKLLATSK